MSENVHHRRTGGLVKTRAAEALNPAVAFSITEFINPLSHGSELIDRIK